MTVETIVSAQAVSKGTFFRHDHRPTGEALEPDFTCESTHTTARMAVAITVAANSACSPVHKVSHVSRLRHIPACPINPGASIANHLGSQNTFTGTDLPERPETDPPGVPVV